MEVQRSVNQLTAANPGHHHSVATNHGVASGSVEK